jgi:hypothetical protein
MMRVVCFKVAAVIKSLQYTQSRGQDFDLAIGRVFLHCESLKRSRSGVGE